MNQKELEDDLDEYLSEYKLQAPIEPISHYAGKQNIRCMVQDLFSHPRG